MGNQAEEFGAGFIAGFSGACRKFVIRSKQPLKHLVGVLDCGAATG
jgi:hypothetical protein